MTTVATICRGWIINLGCVGDGDDLDAILLTVAGQRIPLGILPWPDCYMRKLSKTLANLTDKTSE